MWRTEGSGQVPAKRVGAFWTFARFQPWMMMRTRKGTDHMGPLWVPPGRREGMRWATPAFEMSLPHGSIAPASINDAISTNGVMPTYTSHVLFFFFVSAM